MMFFGGFAENNFEDGKLLEINLVPGFSQKINKIFS